MEIKGKRLHYFIFVGVLEVDFEVKQLDFVIYLHLWQNQFQINIFARISSSLILQ